MLDLLPFLSNYKSQVLVYAYASQNQDDFP